MLAALDEREPTQQETAHAKRLHARIKHFDGLQKARRESWKKARTYVDGNPNGDGAAGLVRVNLIGSFVETLQANIYAKAPEIAVTPEERPDEVEYPMLTGMAKAVQAALNSWLVKDGKLKTRGKTAVRATLTCGTSYVKVLYQRDKQAEPVARNNLNDIQDNIARLQRLRAETEGESECADLDAKLLELRQQESALQGNLEVTLAEGLVVDNVPSEDVIVLDASVRDIDELPQASGIAHRIKMTGAAFKVKFKMAPPATASMEDPESAPEGKEVDEDDKIIIVYEVWSKDDNTVYTLCKGVNKYIREPYQPEALGGRWYPFFALQIRRVDGVLYPLSTVELLMELQDEYNTRHTRASAHRAKNLPVRLVNKSSNITDQEIDAINNRRIGTDVIGISADPKEPLSNQVAAMAEIPFNPAMYDATDVMRDMEMVAGVQDASRGAINKAKTATEAEIMAQGMQSRSSETVDTVEDWLTEIAQYAAHLLMLNLSKDQVMKRLGESVIWPEITGREALDRLGVTIRGGSTARPNKMRERDQWIQLMPMMQEALQKSAELKAAGDEKMARSVLKVLQETLNRFDEKLDIKEFLGIELDDNAEQTELPPEVAQQIEQGKALIADLQAKLQQAGEALKSKVDEQSAAREKLESEERTAIEQENIRAASQERQKLIDAAAEVLKAQQVPAEQAPGPDVLLSNIQALQDMVASLLPPVVPAEEFIEELPQG